MLVCYDFAPLFNAVLRGRKEVCMVSSGLAAALPPRGLTRYFRSIASRISRIREVAMAIVMDADRVSRSITRIAHEILERNRAVGDLALIGIRARGVPIAERLAADLKTIAGVELPIGSLDITLYRDDLMGHSRRVRSR